MRLFRFLKKQHQSSGNASLNLQAGRDVVVGITTTEALEIAEYVYKKNMPEFAEIAKGQVEQRVKEVTKEYIDRQLRENPENLIKMKEPAIQNALFNMQKGYALTGDIELGDLLVSLLLQRTREDERSLRQIVLDEALVTVPKLTEEHLDTLTLVLILGNYKKSITSLEEFERYIANWVIPFVDRIPTDISYYQHLEYTRCIFSGKERHSLESLFRYYYRELFSKGFSERDIREKMMDIEKVSQLLVPCFHNSQLLQIAPLDSKTLRQECIRLGISVNEPKFQELLTNYTMREDEIREYVCLLNNKMRDLFNLWPSRLSRIDLTSVGISIAQANFTRKTNIPLDLGIWIN